MTIATIYWDEQDANDIGWAWRYDGDSGPLDVPDLDEITTGDLVLAFRDQVGPIDHGNVEIILPERTKRAA